MDILDFIEEGKIKRIFRARNKISFPGAICHITQRAAGREPLFLEEGDYLYMLHLVKEMAEEFAFDVFSHSLMPNHLHLLIRLSKDNLSKGMKQLFGEYASFFNKKYERKGHVFGGPFRQALCFSETYVLAVTLYIHLNAARANLVKEPAKYRWSSCRLYVEPFYGKTFIDYKFVLGILDSDIAKARRTYKEILDNSIRIKTQEIWENSKVLESFKDEVVNFLPKLVKRGDKIQRSFLDDRDLEEKIVKLRTKGKLRSPETLKARKFLIEQLRARGYSMDIVAKKLNISRQTVYRTLEY